MHKYRVFVFTLCLLLVHGIPLRGETVTVTVTAPCHCPVSSFPSSKTGGPSGASRLSSSPPASPGSTRLLTVSTTNTDGPLSSERLVPPDWPLSTSPPDTSTGRSSTHLSVSSDTTTLKPALGKPTDELASDPAGENSITPLPTITPSQISTSSASSVTGLTSNTLVETTDENGHRTTIPVFWDCWFCNGGGVFGWGIGPGPGIFPPPPSPPFPGWPTITIGRDMIPTPAPKQRPSAPQASPTPPEEPSVTEPATDTPSEPQESTVTPTETTTSSPSTSTCSVSTVTHSRVSCRATSTSGEASPSCTTTTSVMSGCGVTGSATTTTAASECSPYHINADFVNAVREAQEKLYSEEGKTANTTNSVVPSRSALITTTPTATRPLSSPLSSPPSDEPMPTGSGTSHVPTPTSTRPNWPEYSCDTGNAPYPVLRLRKHSISGFCIAAREGFEAFSKLPPFKFGGTGLGTGECSLSLALADACTEPPKNFTSDMCEDVVNGLVDACETEDGRIGNSTVSDHCLFINMEITDFAVKS